MATDIRFLRTRVGSVRMRRTEPASAALASPPSLLIGKRLRPLALGQLPHRAGLPTRPAVNLPQTHPVVEIPRDDKNVTDFSMIRVASAVKCVAPLLGDRHMRTVAVSYPFLQRVSALSVAAEAQIRKPSRTNTRCVRVSDGGLT